MLKIRRSYYRLIFNMGIPIPGKDAAYIEMGLRLPLPLQVTDRWETQWYSIMVVLQQRILKIVFADRYARAQSNKYIYVVAFESSISY